MREKEIEGWAKRLARTRGWWARKFSSPGNRSVPDDVFGKRGRVFWAEAKATGQKPTELQLAEHEQMRAAGLTVYVYDSREMFAEILAAEDRLAQLS